MGQASLRTLVWGTCTSPGHFCLARVFCHCRHHAGRDEHCLFVMLGGVSVCSHMFVLCQVRIVARAFLPCVSMGDARAHPEILFDAYRILFFFPTITAIVSGRHFSDMGTRSRCCTSFRCFIYPTDARLLTASSRFACSLFGFVEALSDAGYSSPESLTFCLCVASESGRSYACFSRGRSLSDSRSPHIALGGHALERCAVNPSVIASHVTHTEFVVLRAIGVVACHRLYDTTCLFACRLAW